MIIAMGPSAPSFDTRAVETNACAAVPSFARDIFIHIATHNGKPTVSMIERAWHPYKISLAGVESSGYQLDNVRIVRLLKGGALPMSAKISEGAFQLEKAHQAWIDAGKPEDFVCIW